MPLQATSGAASYDAFGGGVAVVPNYIEEVFSTWLYTGNGSTQTITNGIDLAGKGGLVWTKSRNYAAQHGLVDSARSPDYWLRSNTTDAQLSFPGNGLSPYIFNSNGFTTTNYSDFTQSGTYVSWTFRKQPKFFDVVTYTGTGANRTVSHSLGSAPGCIIVKRTDSGGTNWAVYHQSLGSTQDVSLNSTAAAGSSTLWNSTAPTSTQFTVGTLGAVNASGGAYVAYLFAHNAGGFGLTGTDNVISCGSFTTDGSGTASVTLGYEPQWLLAKSADGTSNWWMVDTMRGMTASNQAVYLSANTSNAEGGPSAFYGPTATGFNAAAQNASQTYIYIAIRRGPMKVPTDGTKVFNPAIYTGNGSNPRVIPSGFPVDFSFSAIRGSVANKFYAASRLSGNPYTLTSTSDAEVTNTAVFPTDVFAQQSGIAINNSLNYGGDWIDYFVRRAPGFFDEVCYTGNGVARTLSHNLTVAPELMIVKSRSSADDWLVYAQPIGATNRLRINDTGGSVASTVWNNTTPTSSVFSLGAVVDVNRSGSTYIAHLFATCPGVSKIGSYTGTGATQTISCGFTGGARFVLIKRTNSSGNWNVWDTSRGMVSGNDRVLFLDLTDAEVNDNRVYTTAGGFQLVTAGGDVNASGGNYIFLAIA